MSVKELYDSISAGDIHRVKTLLREYPDLVHGITPFGTMLHVAAGAGQLVVVKELLALGADINACGGTLGGNSLNYAVSNRQVEIVRYLLSEGANKDLSDPEKNPLFSAIYCGNLEIAKLLLESGIDISVKYSGESMNEMDALAFAKERGQTAIVDLLEKFGA